AKRGTGIVGWVAENLEAVRIKDVHLDSRFVPTVDEQGGIHVNAMLAVPMLSRSCLMGVITVGNQRSLKGFTQEHEKILSFIAGISAVHIDNINLFDENKNQIRLSNLGQSIASSAHGLKNILNNMDGGTYIVERGVTAKNMDNVNKGWDILKRNSQRLREIVLDMLLFSRPRKPEFMLSDINKICWDLYELVRENACKRKVEIQLDFDERLDMVCIDPKGIYRCILNLVSNAIDACSRLGGWVKIKTRRLNNNDLQIEISDNGPGISKYNIKHVFDVFYTTKGSHGTGLGLPVTKKIVAEHNGTIDVKSKLKTGTTFIITIPKNSECQSLRI
ncbi:MAG: GAF domain-containing sensor histidine kinase, partial [Calditrichaceae bacterium]